VRDGGAQPLHSAADLVARASLRTMDGDGAALTVQGLRLLGLDYPNERSAPSSKQSLFFVDHALIADLIPSVIPNLILLEAKIEDVLCAAEYGKTISDNHVRVMRGTQAIPSDKSDSPPNPPAGPLGGGGGDLPTVKKSNRGKGYPESEKHRPETDSSRLLRSIGAFPSSVEELAGVSAELIGRAIAYAKAEPGIASLAGWVVEALRRHRDVGWPIPTPRTRRPGTCGQDELIDAATYVGGLYGDLFRLGSDLSGLEDPVLGAAVRPVEQARSPQALCDFLAKEAAQLSALTDRDAAERREQQRSTPTRVAMPSAYAERFAGAHDPRNPRVPKSARVPAQTGIGALVQPSPAASKPEVKHTDALDEGVGAQRPADPERCPASDAALTQELRAELLNQCGRRYRPIIAGLEVQTNAGATLLICASVPDMGVVQNELLGAVHATLVRIGAPTRVVFTTRAAQLERHRQDGNTHRREAASA
jgi:hypothetical protein